MSARFLAKKRILFIAEHIKEPHGSALSAIDVLRSVPSSCKKFILTERPIAKGSYLHGAIRLTRTPLALRFRLFSIAQPAFKIFVWLYSLVFFLWFRYAKFDLVIVNGFGSSSLWEKVRLLIPSSTPSAVVSRESPRHFDSGDRIYSLADQIKFLRTFKYQIFVSSALKSEWIELADLNSELAYYLPNCCEEKKFLTICPESSGAALVRTRNDIPADIPIILNVGTIELRKGQQDLERLAKHLNKRGRDFRIACVGFDGTAQGTYFRQRIQDSALSGFFLFPGATDEIQYWYQGATLLAFTSRAEAMPRTVLEAMASALPIVSTNVDGIPELIEHNKNGLLYCPGDTYELIAGVECIIDNPDIASDLGANARQKYINHFSQAHHAKRMGDILATVIR